MLNILTPVLTKAGNTHVMKTAFLGFMCLMMISCAQPEASKKAKGGTPPTPATPGTTPQERQTNPDGSPVTPGQAAASVAATLGFRAITDSAVNSKIKEYENSIFKISNIDGETKVTRTGYLVGSEKNVIMTSLTPVFNAIVAQLGGIAEARKLEKAELVTKISELELKLSMKDKSAADLLQSNKIKVTEDSQLNKIADLIKATSQTIKPLQDFVRLRLTDKIEAKEFNITSTTASNFCVVTASHQQNTAAANRQAATATTTAAQRAAALQARGSTTASTETAATETTLPAATTPARTSTTISIAGFPGATSRAANLSSNATDIFVSQGALVNFADAVRVSSSTSVTLEGLSECWVIAVAGDATAESIGSPMFNQAGDFVGQVVFTSNADNQTKRSFGIAKDGL